MRAGPGLEAPCVRLRDHFYLDPVGPSAPKKLVQRSKLNVVPRDHEFAAAVDCQPPILAVDRELPVAVPAEAGLQALGRVVEAGVEHAGVAP